MIDKLLLQNGVNGAFGVSAVRAVMEVLDIAGESVSQISTAALVMRRMKSHAMSTLLVVRTTKDM